MTAGAGRGDPGWRKVLRLILGSRVNRCAFLVCVSLCVVALLADFLASDLPILLRLKGQYYLFPNLFRPAALRIYSHELLMSQLGKGDFAILPIVPYGFNTHDLAHVLAAPDLTHWLGTDSSGRDVLARMIHGSRVSLIVGILSVVVLVVIGVTVGALGGFLGGWVDLLAMRTVEIVHSIPTILLLVTMLAVLAPEGFHAVFAMTMVIGLVRWTDVARLVRGEILRIREMDYVHGARALGMRPLTIVFRHVLPNAMSPVLVTATFALASAILIEGALSFLGFGIPDDMASWGGLLNEVRGHVEAWWLAVFPGLGIFVTVTSYNLLGEGLRDAIDPRLRS